jgi:hypothetical protein
VEPGAVSAPLRDGPRTVDALTVQAACEFQTEGRPKYDSSRFCVVLRCAQRRAKPYKNLRKVTVLLAPIAAENPGINWVKTFRLLNERLISLSMASGPPYAEKPSAKVGAASDYDKNSPNLSGKATFCKPNTSRKHGPATSATTRDNGTSGLPNTSLNFLC